MRYWGSTPILFPSK